MNALENKVVVITGASSGIGEATAKLLAQNGANIVIAARRKERLIKLQNEIGADKCEIAVTDVTVSGDTDAMAKTAIDRFGKIDILVNNAGLMPLSFMKNLHTDEWHRMVDVNIKGVLNCLGSVLPHMKERQEGHIVNISSVAGRRVFPGGAVYCATKFAVTALSEGLRMELAPALNIRVTTIEPGAVATELPDHITDEEIIEGFKKRFATLTRLTSEDIAESIRYAVSQPDHVNVNEILVLPREQSM